VSGNALVREAGTAGRLTVCAAWREPVGALGLLEAGALERWLGGAATAGEGRAATALAALPGGRARVVVRRMRHGGWLGPLLGARYLDAERAARELDATAVLRARGAPVPEPVFALALRRGTCWAHALATVYEEGAADALAFLASAPGEERVLRAAAACGAALRRFHDAGGRHADLQIKNLLVREARAGAEVIVIDLDRGAAGAPADPARRARELGRLWRSLVKRGVAAQVGQRGVAAFLSAYCAGDRALRDALARRLPAERRRAARHALLYRR
jgi:3-deoxy-D-manno-octulosonic acid kinase